MSSKNFNIPDKDNGLGVLAPDIELCRQIPSGEFEESALVWIWDEDGNQAVIGRYNLKFSPVTEEEDYCPAPTLGEILLKLNRLERGMSVSRRGGWANAALRRFLESTEKHGKARP